MIQGIGVDIESNSRFAQLPYQENQAFYHKIFTDNEIKYCESCADPAPHYTARFCAKEAFIKALGKPAKLTSIEITHQGKVPTIRWKNLNTFLSISHEKDKSIAFVIISQ